MNNKLIKCLEKINRTYDTISYCFEEIDKHTLKLQKSFYNYNKFKKFVENPNFDFKKINIRTSFSKISSSALYNAIKEISDNNENAEFAYFIRKSFANQSNFVTTLNTIFSHFVYNVNENAFIKDDVYQTIENKLNQIEAETFDENDLKCKPDLEDINSSNSDLFEFRIYNVGQANCSALIKYNNSNKQDYKVIAVFDFGFQKSWRQTNESLDQMIDKIDSNTTILISHFDYDHINNIINHVNIPTDRWIFPKCDGRRKISSKLFQVLLIIATRKTSSGKIYSYRTPFCFGNNLTIYQYLNDKIGDKYQSTIANSQSLVATLHYDNINILIPGDALYKEFDKEVLEEKFDYILIPHHCCKYERKSNNPYFNIASLLKEHTIGIIQTGKNRYKHPHPDHSSWYPNIKQFSNNNLNNNETITNSDYIVIKNHQ